MATEANGARVLRPRDAADVAEILHGHGGAVEPLGGASKRAIGSPVDADLLDLSALAGIVDYEPAELVLTAQAATPLAEIAAALASRGQRLAFEPPDFGPLLGTSLPQTLGGVLAANLAGSRRVTAGAARDHFLGCLAVTGDGVAFKAGSKVVKNVTGYDLPKLIAGSWGTLAVMTQVTVRVVPRAETETTLIVPVQGAEQMPMPVPMRMPMPGTGRGTEPRTEPGREPGRESGTDPGTEPLHAAGFAVAILERALASPNDVSAAAFDPMRGALLRIEGFEASVAARVAGLLDALGRPESVRLDANASRRLWQSMGSADALAAWPVVWRISVPPADAPRVVAALAPERYLLDWAGGLVWAAFDGVDADRVRSAVREGHATLWKAPLAERRSAAVFHPQAPAAAEASRRLKAAFDPAARLNPGRFAAESAPRP